MDILTNLVLAASIAFGVSSGDVVVPIDEGSYKLVPAHVNEVVWADNVDKLKTLTHIIGEDRDIYYEFSNKGLKDVGKGVGVFSGLYPGDMNMDYVFAGADLYSVFFPMEKFEPVKESYDNFIRDIPAGAEVAIRGYASDDGRNPEQRYALALARMDFIFKKLKEKRVLIRFGDGKVCPASELPASCWRVDLKILKPGE